MYPRIDPSPGLSSLATLQAGVLTSEQVVGHGMGRHSLGRLIKQGRWTRMATGLYFTKPDASPPWEALAWGGVLLGGEPSRLAGLAAGHLIGLNDPPDTIEVLVPWTSVLRPREPWCFTRERSFVRSPRSFGSPPRLSVEDTVLDLADLSSTTRVIDLVTKAVQQDLTTAKKLTRAVAGRKRLRHRRFLLDLLADVAEGAETPLEIKYTRDVERAHALPRGVRQKSARRGRDFRDVTYDEFGLVVELDGQIGHLGTGRFRDMRRDNYAVVQGEVTLRYGWPDVNDIPCPVAFQIADVMIQRGWTDLPTRCDRCVNANRL